MVSRYITNIININMLIDIIIIRGYLMKVNGEVTTGLGKAAYFLSQDFYVENFLK